MVRKKTLSPSGSKDENGDYKNAHVNLHEDELNLAGLEIGDQVIIQVKNEKIVIQAEPENKSTNDQNQ